MDNAVEARQIGEFRIGLLQVDIDPLLRKALLNIGSGAQRRAQTVTVRVRMSHDTDVLCRLNQLIKLFFHGHGFQKSSSSSSAYILSAFTGRPTGRSASSRLTLPISASIRAPYSTE